MLKTLATTPYPRIAVVVISDMDISVAGRYAANLQSLLMEDNPLATEENYEIVSVRPAKPPSGMEDSDWHRYEITQGTNTIRGYRKGSLGSVREAVKNIVFKLNARRGGKRGRVHIVIPNKKKSVGKR